MTFLERVRTIPRPFLVVGGVVVVLVAVLVFLSQCTGADPDDPTTLQVEVVRVTKSELPDGYCAEQCNRWMALPPFWYEVVASDDEVAELRAAGWTVNGVPVDETAQQEADESGGSKSITDYVPWWMVLGLLAWVVGRVLLKSRGQKPGPG